MKIQFSQADQKFSEVQEFIKKELQGIRVGRGGAQLVENILVEVYGQNMPIKQLANINMVDASLITISPWDKTNLQAILKGVQGANIGINPVIDSNVVKLPIPPMTEERRLEYVKLVHQKVEEAKISIRQIRKEILTVLEEDKKAGKLPEDDFTRMEKDVQNKVDKANKEVETIGKDKEQELMQV
jgi:ribosome recycling factor